MDPRSIRVPGADGLSLHALEWSREGVGLLFLHGFGNEAHVWDEVAPDVAPHYRTVALDLRGHGDSDADPERRYDHESMARDVAAATEALAMDRVVVVGHSMGGRVALRFAGAHPERMAGLVLVDTGPELDARGTTRIRVETGRRELTFGSVAEFEALLGRLYPAASPDTVARLARNGLRRRDDGRYERKIDPGLVRAREGVGEEEQRAWSERETKALWGALSRLPCPALIVRGAASDVVSDEVTERMVETAPRAERIEVARAGHSVMIDNPAEFRAALTGFVLGDA